MLPIILLLALAKTAASSQRGGLSEICCPPDSYIGFGDRTKSWDKDHVYCQSKYQGMPKQRFPYEICPTNIKPLMEKMRHLLDELTLKESRELTYETVQARASVAHVLSKYKPIRHIPGHIPHLAFGLKADWIGSEFVDPYFQPRLTEMFSELNAIAEHNRKKILVLLRVHTYPLVWPNSDWTNSLQINFPFLSFIAGSNTPSDPQFFEGLRATGVLGPGKQRGDELQRKIAQARVIGKRDVQHDEVLLQSAIESIASDRSLAGVLFITTYEDLQILMDGASEGHELNIWDMCTFQNKFHHFPELNDPNAARLVSPPCTYPALRSPFPPQIPKIAIRQWSRPMPNGRRTRGR